jgi:ATP-dependent Clp protease adapter protein ClpS
MDVQSLEFEKADVEDKEDTPWKLILFNDDYHVFEDVVLQVMKATGYGLDRSMAITLEAHKKGKALVFEGTFERCFAIDQVLKEIDLTTEIRG